MSYKPEQIEHWNDCGHSKSRKYLKRVTNKVMRMRYKRDLEQEDIDNIQIKHKRYTRGWEL